MALRIIQLINYYQPQLGYQEYFLAKMFREMGHESHVVTSCYYFPYPEYKENFQKILGNRKITSGKYVEAGITTWRLPTTEFVPGSQVLFRNLAETIKLINPDLIICHNPYLIISYQIARMKQKFGYNLIYDTHAAAFNTKFSDTLIKKLYLIWFKEFAVPVIKKEADSFFAIGDSERDLLEQAMNLPKNSTPIIRLGVDTDRFKFSKGQRDEIRKKLKLKSTDILLIYAGKITENKDIHILAKALNSLDSKYKLLVLGNGSGDYMKQISRIIPDQSRFMRLDIVLNNELSKYFNAGDIGVWPGDPALTMLEALVTGMPLIVADTSETSYLKSIRSVYRFKRGDWLNLSGVIQKVPLNDGKIRIKLQNELEKQFSWENKAKSVLKLLNT